MTDAPTTESKGPAGFGHWHGALYDVLAMLKGAGSLADNEPDCGAHVYRILELAGARLQESIDGLDAWDLARRRGD